MGREGDQPAGKQSWETMDVLRTPMEICWQFDYEIGIEDARRLEELENADTGEIEIPEAG